MAATSKPSPPLLLLGLSRTGNTSLEHAFRILGYQAPFSMDRLANDQGDKCEAWLQAIDLKYRKKVVIPNSYWHGLLHEYDLVRGLPAAIFAPEIIAAYPSSKVILATRDVDSWYRSCLATIRWRAEDPVLRWLSRFDWQSSSRYQRVFRQVQDVLFDGDFVENGKRVFTEHNEQVRRLANKDLLLEYSVTQGWQPLCSFLGVAVPDQAFPRANTPQEFRRNGRRRDMAVARRLLMQAGWIGVAVALLVTAILWKGGRVNLGSLTVLSRQSGSQR